MKDVIILKTKSNSIQVICHELGHNLGMNHDFVDPFTSPKTILRDSNGVSCTDSNCVMDYFVSVQKWSTCSVEWFTQYYNSIISSNGQFCMALAGNGTPEGWVMILSKTLCFLDRAICYHHLNDFLSVVAVSTNLKSVMLNGLNCQP